MTDTQWTPKYDGTNPARERYLAMSSDERTDLLVRFNRWRAGDTAAITFQDAKVLVYLADDYGGK